MDKIQLPFVQSETKMLPATSLEKIIESINSKLGSRTTYVDEVIPADRGDDSKDGVIGFIVAGPPPLPSLKTRRVSRQTEQWSKLVGILFCMPGSKSGKEEILPNLSYFHHRSGNFVDFFCVGYELSSHTSTDVDEKTVVAKVGGRSWLFDDAEFNLCRAQIEGLTNWQYSGETELLLMVARKEENATASLDFSTAMTCNLEEMCKDKAITSIRGFFEMIFRFGERYKGRDPAWSLSDKFGIAAGGDLLAEAVLSMLPDSVKTTYKSAKHFVVKDVSKKEKW